MANLNCSFKLKLIKKGKIIAFKTDRYLSPDEYKLLPKKLRKRFEPIYEQYDVEYVKEKAPNEQ